MKKLICYLLILSCICGGVVSDSLFVTHAAGYITRSYTVTNSLGSAQVNYPLEQVINTSAEIAAARMRSDCGDIRVFDSDFVTQFTYTVIGCNTATTSIVYIDPLLATGVQTHYITYGDPSLVSVASPSAVFDIWDFTSSTSAPSCVLGGGANWDTVNKWLSLTTNTINQAGSCNYSYLSTLPSRGYKVFFEHWAGGTTNGGEASWLYSFDSSVPTQEDITQNGAHFTFDEFQDRYCYTRSVTANGACDVSFANTAIDNSAWKWLAVSWDTGRRRLWENGVLRINSTVGTSPVITNTNFGVASRTTNNKNEHRIRNFGVIRFSESVVVGSLSANTIPPVTLSFSIRNSTDTGSFGQVCDYGNISFSSIYSCQYRLKVNHTGRNGYSVNAVTSGDFSAGLDNITNAAVGNGGVGGTGIVAGTEMYGVVVSAGSCTNGSITLASSFNAGTNVVKFNHTNYQTVVSCTGSNVPLSTDLANTILVDHKLAISGSTPAGNYAQSIIWTVSPNY